MRVVLTLYLMVVAFLLGMVSEKMLHSARRDEVIGRYERALADWRAMQIRAERAAEAVVRERPRDPSPTFPVDR